MMDYFETEEESDLTALIGNDVCIADKNNNDNVEPTTDKIQLKRQVNFLSSLCLLIGMIIGSGIFASPRNVAIYAGSTGSILLVWVGCGFISMFAALVWCELGTMFPNMSGAEYSYIIESFGPLCGFLFLYMSVVALMPCGVAMVAIVCGDYVMTAIGHSDVLYSKLIAAAVIVIVAFINSASVIWATRFQNVFTAAKLIGIVLLIMTGLVRLGQGHNENFVDAFNGSVTDIAEFSYAFYGGLWSYNGWNAVNFIAAESTNPGRDIPLAIFVGMPLITLCYVLVNVAYLTVLTPLQISKTSAVAVVLGNQLYGKMAWVMPVFVATSTIGSVNGGLLVTGRMVYEGAKRAQLPSFLAMLHTRRRTPIPAIIFISLIALLILIPKSSTFVSLTGYFSFSIWMFYSMTIMGLLVLRYRKPNMKRPFKVFLPVPIIIFIVSIYLIIAPFYHKPMGSLYCLLFILSGIPVYFAFVKHKILPKSLLRVYSTFTRKVGHIFDLSMPDLGVDDDIQHEPLQTFIENDD